MWRNSYVKAFTLLELVVVMLLMGIVVTVSYKGYLVIQGLYSDFESKKRLLLDQEEMLSQLRWDIGQAEAIQWESNELSIWVGNSMCVYTMEEGGVTRTQGSQVVFFPLFIQDLELTQSGLGTTESIRCLVLIEGNRVETVFTCRQDASTRINWNSDNGITDPF
ncbi:prepilin-type N-terminal cleavage/methylation domain-containing protein [Cytophagales bacterium LB-30]|uniref:Prepilin-type N-terminal cleavage/methylation domain-containing protein n=1 Tax=Shiella aurantiaca TaxID=3058365 RepID=A0ABT8F9X7_9BACT|nr:prepilin-type N-terminal cleavage/methylation domain-containing protein [Shiella aurantiaca]MDN4167088.1 prepilin-type N-terminal cleavage/methylation domain-containing protein [Shiella aurantiaca]